MHRWRVRYRGDPGPAENQKPHRSRKLDPVPCTVEDCNRQGRRKGLCDLHYERVRRNGSTGLNERLILPKGDGHLDAQGYRRIILQDGRRVMEHVYVMEQELGRRLEDGENVHHLNGLRDDNRPENLELWVSMQPRGQRVEDVVAFVVDHYPGELIARGWSPPPA